MHDGVHQVYNQLEKQQTVRPQESFFWLYNEGVQCMHAYGSTATAISVKSNKIPWKVKPLENWDQYVASWHAQGREKKDVQYERALPFLGIVLFLDAC
jgi:hypothetical protein